MNIDTSTIIAEEFLNGVFGVLDKMFSLAFTHRITEIRPAGDADLQEFVARFPVVLRTVVKSGGSMALLLSLADASRFGSMVMGEGMLTKVALDTGDIAALREIAEPCLNGGVTSLMERLGRSGEDLDKVEVNLVDANTAERLGAFLGETFAAVTVAYSAGADIDSQAMLAFSQEMESLAPSGAPAKATATPVASPAPVLSEEEMDKILSEFGAKPEPEPVPKSKPTKAGVPPNLDMVLDIRLVATARLGRVEMSIGDILSLGPGSIIQVGHLVDEPVELLVNDKLIARGDIVVVDEKFGLRITEIVSPKERIESLH